MSTDLTFITNDKNSTLLSRLLELIGDALHFDALVGYFYLTGFNRLVDSLSKTERIRVLIGISTDKQTYSIVKEAKQRQLNFKSNVEVKDEISEKVVEELENSEDTVEVERGIKKFLDWLMTQKLQIRVYPEANIHAKLYILTFRQGDRDIGRVITGSSNLTYSGLVDNVEFNVELKNRSDYEFAKEKFEELWRKSIELKEQYVNTVKKLTWLNDEITPHELYLKMLYEYFLDDLNAEKYLSERYLPSDYIEFDFQTQAVINAKKIIQAYGGCFISDVVGLGKTYITARLISEIGGRTLVIAPPKLLERRIPGSWKNVFADFNIAAEFFSIGKLEEAIEEVRKRKYDNIVIDEAHRFRNELTISYAKIAQICSGKRVILVTATPYNNYPIDLLNQIALFQNKRKSYIPGLPNLEAFFNKLERSLNNIDKSNDYYTYLQTIKKNSIEIRTKCLKYIMVRRTRSEIERYFSKDLEKNNIQFPEVLPPKALFYQLDTKLNKIFTDTLLIITQRLSYSRYKPLLYLKDASLIDQLERQSQVNMGGFMKILLLKRLESSFYAFKQTIGRFIESHKLFIETLRKGKLYLSKKYFQKVFEYLTSDNYEEIHRLIEEGKAEEYDAEQFSEQLEKDLENDLIYLEQIKSWWDSIDYDPKIDELIRQLKSDDILKQNKIILFTESKETAEYLTENITAKLQEKPLIFTGDSSEKVRDIVTENFDARAKESKDDYRILISTEVLSEGVNLHRANIVINYDIPWNPTRLMQRIGRINRVDTKFDKIYTYNFFPSEEAENEIELTKIARSKIETFLNLLGGDSAILTEGEPIESHELFDKLMSTATLTGEDADEKSELKYLRTIEDIRDNNPELFEKIKKLPKKARSSRNITNIKNQQLRNEQSLLTYFRKGKLMKFYISNSSETKELDFLTAAQIFECLGNEPQNQIDLEKYYELLAKNKESFTEAISESDISPIKKGGRDSYKELNKILKFLESNSMSFTETQENYIQNLKKRLDEGSIPKKIVDKALKSVKNLQQQQQDPRKVFNAIKKSIPDEFLVDTAIQSIDKRTEKKEIILSLFINK